MSSITLTQLPLSTDIIKKLLLHDDFLLYKYVHLLDGFQYGLVKHINDKIALYKKMNTMGVRHLYTDIQYPLNDNAFEWLEERNIYEQLEILRTLYFTNLQEIDVIMYIPSTIQLIGKNSRRKYDDNYIKYKHELAIFHISIIQMSINVQKLNVPEINNYELDLSKHIQLTYLSFDHRYMQKINVSHNVNLIELTYGGLLSDHNVLDLSNNNKLQQVNLFTIKGASIIYPTNMPNLKLHTS